MSTPHATVGMAATEIIDRLQQALPDDPALAIEEIAARYALIGSTTYADEESDARLTMARTAYERATKADGTQLHPAAAGGRQVGAIMRAPSRAADLKELSVETLVIHGDEDSMITIAGGRATFNALPQATRTWLAHPDDHDGVHGMGHDFPVALQSVIANAILAHISTEAPVTA